MSSKTNKKKPTSSFLFRDLIGLLFFFFAAFSLLSLLSYSSKDPSFFTSSQAEAKNLAGYLGSHWASILLQAFGAASFALVGIFLLSGVAIFRRISKTEWYLASINFLLLLLTTAASLELTNKPFFIGGSRLPMGGLMGEFLGKFLQTYLNTAGAALLTTCLFVLAISLSTKISIRDLGLYAWLFLTKTTVIVTGALFYIVLQIWNTTSQAYAHLRPHLQNAILSFWEQIGELFQKSTEATSSLLKKQTAPEAVSPESTEARLANVIPLHPVQATHHDNSPTNDDERTHSPYEPQNEPQIILSEMDPSHAQNYFDSPGEMEASAGQKSNTSPFMNFMRKTVKENEKNVKEALGKKIRFELPTLSFLNTPISEESNKLDRDELVKNSKMLEEKLADFNVKGQVTAVKPGPVVTMYEFKPAAGIKVNAISSLADDLALALSAKSIRIVAPIPGRDVVGIEVPNRHRESVLLKEILGAETFQSKNHSIPIAIGKDILGTPVVADLKKMPHLLVAGTTGSGKSVFINTLICSLLYKFNPRDLNLVLVDPKQLELAPYNDIPHLLLPVVTEPKKASLALGWAVQEMERRYRLIASSVTRDQEGYNRKLQEIGEEKMTALLNKGKDELEEAQAAEHMPKLVIIIDELADLMMTAKSDVENNICRLAQKARAAGIHLVLATQRPSTDVITGLIKANLPSRICFKVSSKVDSRVMFDAMGAEKLIGMGDMLFMPPGDSTLVRMHGAYISVEEVDQVTAFWRSQAKPCYREDILVDPEEDNSLNAFGAEDTADPLYQQALEIAHSTGAVSASYLQRRLRIGYNKAARFVEMMEAQGIVGPAEGSKPRPVISQRPQV